MAKKTYKVIGDVLEVTRDQIIERQVVGRYTREQVENRQKHLTAKKARLEKQLSNYDRELTDIAEILVEMDKNNI
jgi:hypothetical protein